MLRGATAANGGSRPEISDVWPRLLLSPVLGVLIPNLSGLIDHGRHGTAGLAGSYLYFALVAFVIWEGNRRIYFRLQRREDWLRHPWRRIARVLAAIVLFTLPTAAFLLRLWQVTTGDPGTSAYALPMALLAIVTAVTVITHGYETAFLLHDWETDRLRQARAEQARLQAELDALGREVDPHFLFNSLNALVHLVEQRSEAAVPFVTALGDAYRYVLEARGRRLVPVSAELEALRQHETLARLQYGGHVVLTVDVDDAASRLAIPPVTLGELFQNAIKHNEASEANPLRVSVVGRDTSLAFASDLRPARTAAAASTGIGLANLAQRYRLATGREITWGREGDRWVVRLPLVADGTGH
ncbi:MAG TPA: histidine kinase [Vicinamibacterales bacterium]|nr:histidine kinase [Vicinamibacterales bacterium]